MNYKIAICDDESAAQKYLSSLVDYWAHLSDNTAAISIFESAEAFLFDYTEKKDYNILLLDIEMGKLNGVELARQIRADNKSVQIVFITGYPDFIAEGYEVSALHYLIKPVSGKKLSEVLNRAVANLDKTDRAVLFNVGGETVRVAVDKIMFAEAFSHLVEINTTNNSFEVRMPISEVGKLLGEGFVRCHRSYITGLIHISRITKTDVILDNGKQIPLARGAYSEVNQAFISFYKGAT